MQALQGVVGPNPRRKVLISLQKKIMYIVPPSQHRLERKLTGVEVNFSLWF